VRFLWILVHVGKGFELGSFEESTFVMCKDLGVSQGVNEGEESIGAYLEGRLIT